MVMDWERLCDVSPNAPVRVTLDHVFSYAANTEVPYIKLNKVYVCGQEIYDALDKSNESLKLSNANQYFNDGTLYVLNEIIPTKDRHGPYSMLDMFNLPRVPILTIYHIMETIDNGYTHLDDLETSRYWRLQDEDLYPKPIFDLPESVVNTAKFVHLNYKPEIQDCVGVIIVPAKIKHYGWQHNRVRQFNRDGHDITTVEVEPGAWFILQTCESLFFETPRDPAWYLLHRSHLPKFCL